MQNTTTARSDAGALDGKLAIEHRLRLLSLDFAFFFLRRPKFITGDWEESRV
jgi:hypothetical protein